MHWICCGPDAGRGELPPRVGVEATGCVEIAEQGGRAPREVLGLRAILREAQRREPRSGAARVLRRFRGQVEQQVDLGAIEIHVSEVHAILEGGESGFDLVEPSQRFAVVAAQDLVASQVVVHLRHRVIAVSVFDEDGARLLVPTGRSAEAIAGLEGVGPVRREGPAKAWLGRRREATVDLGVVAQRDPRLPQLPGEVGERHVGAQDAGQLPGLLEDLQDALAGGARFFEALELREDLDAQRIELGRLDKIRGGLRGPKGLIDRPKGLGQVAGEQPGLRESAKTTYLRVVLVERACHVQAEASELPRLGRIASQDPVRTRHEAIDELEGEGVPSTTQRSGTPSIGGAREDRREDVFCVHPDPTTLRSGCLHPARPDGR